MATPDQLRSDPANSWAGMIYRAPGHPRLIVPKCSRLGWTLNFARLAAYAVLGVIVAVAAVIPLVTRP